jgi:ubiquinone/menaquinone biosynthesis C-methylase UbiE
MSVTTNAPVSEREAILSEVRDIYQARYPNKEGGVFAKRDWNRCMAALELVSGPEVLEVGVGPGQMFNGMARMPGVTRLVGIDLTWNKKLIRPEGCTLERGTIMRLQFPDRSFDTVSCMEVLEHLDPIDFPKALHEIRRVCRGTLIMTVPFDEPEPLWHYDRPGGHRQQFSPEKVDRWFPHAERRMVRRGKGQWPWIMLVERPAR